MSSTICVDHRLISPWPLYIEDNEGRPHEVSIEPGEMVFFEGTRLTHGRPYPLDGEYYANIFVHYTPLDWDLNRRRLADAPGPGDRVKSLIYTIYRNGGAGLSNLIMSIELGGVLASLTDRLLVLKGNRPPPANVVQLRRPRSNAYPSRVTDLIDLGLPWIDADSINLAGFVPMEICDTAGVGPASLLSGRPCSTPATSGPSPDSRKNFFTLGEDLRACAGASFAGGRTGIRLASIRRSSTWTARPGCYRLMRCAG